jgi:hypothetical protein
MKRELQQDDPWRRMLRMLPKELKKELRPIIERARARGVVLEVVQRGNLREYWADGRRLCVTYGSEDALIAANDAD